MQGSTLIPRETMRNRTVSCVEKARHLQKEVRLPARHVELESILLLLETSVLSAGLEVTRTLLEVDLARSAQWAPLARLWEPPLRQHATHVLQALSRANLGQLLAFNVQLGSLQTT
jgi:hypothetical protein